MVSFLCYFFVLFNVIDPIDCRISNINTISLLLAPKFKGHEGLSLLGVKSQSSKTSQHSNPDPQKASKRPPWGPEALKRLLWPGGEVHPEEATCLTIGIVDSLVYHAGPYHVGPSDSYDGVMGATEGADGQASCFG